MQQRSRLIDRLPAHSSGKPGDEAAYLDLLLRALEDRHLSAEEALELAWIAGAEHLSGDDIRRLHHEIFDAMTVTAWSDGVVTDFEVADLRLMGEFLAIASADVDQAISTPPSPDVGRGSADILLTPGTTVCFTGTLQATIGGITISREEAHLLATSRGLQVRESVTKKLDILIVSDPQSQSSKAQKARQYGTRIVAEAASWQMCAVRTD